MKALTMWSPWAWAIAWAGKDVENRQKAPPAELIGQEIGIHGGLTLELDAIETIAEEFGVRPVNYCMETITRGIALGACSPGALAGFARLAGWVRVKTAYQRPLEVAAWGGMSEARAREAANSAWANGPYLWVLEDIRPLEHPVMCPGDRGFWDLDEEVEELAREQLISSAAVRGDATRMEARHG